MIENILILDTETTGLSAQKGAKMIEVAVILYNLEHKQILQAYSTLFPTETNEAYEFNLIKPEFTNLKYDSSLSNPMLINMSESAQAIVAHNAPFDKQFIDPFIPSWHSKKWICTQRQFKWNRALTRFRLQDICEAYEVPYVDAHRSLIDIMFMVQCFNKVDDLVERFNKC